jgi:hypothetical protein
MLDPVSFLSRLERVLAWFAKAVAGHKFRKLCTSYCMILYLHFIDPPSRKKSPTLNVCGFRTFSCAHILPDVKVADELFAKKGQSYSLMSLPRLKTRKRHSFLTSSPLCKCVLVLLRIGLLNGWDTTVRTTFFKPQRQSGFINHCNLYTAYTYMLATHFPRIQQENC